MTRRGAEAAARAGRQREQVRQRHQRLALLASQQVAQTWQTEALRLRPGSERERSLVEDVLCAKRETCHAWEEARALLRRGQRANLMAGFWGGATVVLLIGAALWLLLVGGKLCS